MNRPVAASRLRLVVFDWDGTLVDSIGTIVDCTRTVFEELGLEPISEEVIRPLIGSGLDESIRALAPDCDEATVQRVRKTYRRLWVGQYHYRSMLFDGVREMIEDLRAAGHLLAVATAKARRGLERDLDRTGLGAMFDASRTMDEAPSKPSPEMLLGILEELGVRARDALMVGDSVHDIQMAHNAGVPAVAVSSGAASAATLQDTAPLACLPWVTDLPGWLVTGP